MYVEAPSSMGITNTVTMYVFLLFATAVAKPTLKTSTQQELESAVILSQLALSHQAEVFVELLNATQHHLSSFYQGGYCPYPYTKVLDECFYLSAYELNWSEARLTCQGMTGDLATPRHLYALKAFIIEKTGKEEPPLEVFVGAKYFHEEGEWRWLDGRTMDSSNWSPGEPNNNGGKEHCVDMWMKKHPMMNDRSCSSQRRFVCQYQPPH